MTRIGARRTQAMRDHQTKWRIEHPERIAFFQRQFQAKNKDKKAEYDQRRRASMRPLVYAWMAADGIIDWVGQGTMIRARSHRTKPWWTPNHTLLTMTCETQWQAMEYEGKWGARYLPRYNIEGNRY